MTISPTHTLRDWLSQACPPMQLPFAEIENELLALQRKVLDLEEEVQRLRAPLSL
jgi:hypothetical protein